MTETAACTPPVARPRTRADCVDGPRPCPWVGCRHHLWLDVDRRGFIQAGNRGTDIASLEAMTETCALDVADGGGATVEAIAGLYGVSTSRIGQLIESSLKRLRVARKEDRGADEYRLPGQASTRPTGPPCCRTCGHHLRPAERGRVLCLRCSKPAPGHRRARAGRRE